MRLVRLVLTQYEFEFIEKCLSENPNIPTTLAAKVLVERSTIAYLASKPAKPKKERRQTETDLARAHAGARAVYEAHKAAGIELTVSAAYDIYYGKQPSLV